MPRPVSSWEDHGARRVVKPLASRMPGAEEAFRRHPSAREVVFGNASTLTADEWTAAMRGADTVIHFFDDGFIPLESIERARPRRLVVAGPAARCVDADAAAGWGVSVAGRTGQSTDAVAEYTMGAIIAAFDADGRIRRRATTRMGIVGLGRIGRRVVSAAKSAGFAVSVVSDHLSPREADAQGLRLSTIADLFDECDAVTIHARESPTKSLRIAGADFDAIDDLPVFVSTARQSLIDLDALARAAAEKRIVRVVLDVIPGEIGDDHRLRSLDGVVVTENTAWRSRQTVARMVDDAMEEVFDG